LSVRSPRPRSYRVHANLDLRSFPTRRSSDLLIGPADGATVTLLWDQDEIVIPGTQVTNLIGSLLPFGFWNVISQDIGHLSKTQVDRKSTRLNSSHVKISYAVFCLKKKIQPQP